MKSKLVTLVVLVLFIDLACLGQVPTITSFTPTSGPVGTIVTITGTNFGIIPSSNIVFFGATEAIVTAASATELTVNVPAGATYQPITVLKNGLLAYSTVPFHVTFGGLGIEVSSFSAEMHFGSGTSPFSVAIGDLDGDGKADIVVGDYSAGMISIFRNTSTGSGSISYAAQVDYPAGTNTSFIAIGDLDGDGKLDLAVTNQSSETVSIFRNISSTGSGVISFATKVDFDTDRDPRSVAIGDLDGDGRMDLAVTNAYSNSVSIFRNTTTAAGTIDANTFDPRVDFTTGSKPYSVAIGDVDGDGKADLAVANNDDNTVSLFRNTSLAPGPFGTGSFAAKADYITGTTPHTVALGDLDRDGKIDIVVTNYGDGTVSVLRNKSTIGDNFGSTSLGTKVDYLIQAGLQPSVVVIDDLDGDGKLDLATTCWNNNGGSVFRNTKSGPGDFDVNSFAPEKFFYTGTNPSAVAIGDFDGDGQADMAMVGSATNALTVFRNVIVPAPPTITTFDPTSAGVGSPVTITGTNLTNTISVSFGGTAATSFTIDSPSSITAIVGSGSTGEVSVTTSGGTVTTADFTFIPAPTISSFDPASAGTGSSVTITGTNFTNVSDVSFGGTTASSINVISSTSITAVVGSGSTGDVSVTTSGGTVTSSGFTFIPAPTISLFDPANAGTGTTVTITGTNFTGATSVSFGDTAATSFNVDSPTSISAVVGSGTTGDITVTTPGGSIASSGFVFIPAASIANVSFVTSYDQGGTMTVSITVNDVNSVKSVNFISRGISEEVGDVTTEEVSPSGNDYEITVKSADLNDPIGLTYYFEVNDKQIPTVTINSSTGNAYVNTTSTPALPSLSFGDQVSDYQIIAIPFDLDDKKVTSVFSAFGGYDKTLWRLFDYANGDNREYNSFSNIDIGKGYWFIARNSTTINPGSGSTPEVSDANPFSMTLSSGWNLIGNPYNFRISWDEILTANGSPLEIGRLNTFSGGTLSESATLDKYRGGFVFNSGSATSINIPVTRDTSLGGRYEAEDEPADLGEQYWELSLNLSQGSLENQLGGIGMHPEATLVGKDIYDQVSVPLIDGMGFFELGFAHPEYHAQFSKEVVPSVANYTWEMSISRDVEDQPLLLTWNNKDLGENDKQLYLFNPSTFEVLNMRESNQLEIGSTTTKLNVLFGSQDYINAQLDKEIPQLGEPYPNPTTQQISYPFKISKGNQQSVTLKVFDNTGKLIGERTETYQSGFHQLDWQFDRQGMYIMQLHIGETIKRNKIIVR